MEEERSISEVIETWSEIPAEQISAPALDIGHFLLEYTIQEDGEPFPSLNSKYAEIPPVPQDIVDELRYCANVSLNLVHARIYTLTLFHRNIWKYTRIRLLQEIFVWEVRW
jgi:hypothetical protein